MAAAIVLNIGVDKFVSAKIYLEFNWIWFLYIDYQTKPAINLHPGGSPFANRGEAPGLLENTSRLRLSTGTKASARRKQDCWFNLKRTTY